MDMDDAVGTIPEHRGPEVENMARITTLTPDSAPAGTRPLLDDVAALSGGRLLNLHTGLANSPALLAQYLGLRRAIVDHQTLGARTGSALLLAVSSADRSPYSEAVAAQVAARAGWTDEEMAELRSGTPRDERLAALVAVAREAATGLGRVSDATWEAAKAAGWGETELAEAFAYIGLAVYVDLFTNYAGTELDVPAGR